MKLEDSEKGIESPFWNELSRVTILLSGLASCHKNKLWWTWTWVKGYSHREQDDGWVLRITFHSHRYENRKQIWMKNEALVCIKNIRHFSYRLGFSFLMKKKYIKQCNFCFPFIQHQTCGYTNNIMRSLPCAIVFMEMNIIRVNFFLWALKTKNKKKAYLL